MMYAASLPRTAILLGAFHKAEAQRQPLTKAEIDELARMIRVSSNSAATSALERVGMDHLAEVLQSRRYHLYDPSRNGGL